MGRNGERGNVQWDSDKMRRDGTAWISMGGRVARPRWAGLSTLAPADLGAGRILETGSGTARGCPAGGPHARIADRRQVLRE
ncbi:hypothetical protein [Streptomyces sp. TE33382]